MACEWKFEPTAEAVPEHCRDDRLVELFDQRQHAQPLIEDRLESSACVRAGHELLEVHPDTEMLFSGCGDHDRARLAIVAQRDHGTFELVHVLEGHPVPRRILILEDQHRAATLDA